MSSLLDNPIVRESALRLHVDQYHRLCDAGIIPEKTELIDGIVVRKMGKSPLHTWTVEFLAEWFQSRLSAGQSVRVEQPLTLASSELEPDISIVKGTRDDYRTCHPSTAELIVEVAVSSEEIDREKADIYAIAGIPTYWIVCPKKRSVVVFEHPQDGNYQSTTERTGQETLRFEGAAPSLTELFADK